MVHIMNVKKRRAMLNLSLSINCGFLFLSCPKSVIGHPEPIDKTGFQLKTAGMTDRQPELMARH